MFVDKKNSEKVRKQYPLRRKVVKLKDRNWNNNEILSKVIEFSYLLVSKENFVKFYVRDFYSNCKKKN